MFFDGCKKMTALLLLSAFLPVFGDSQLRITSEKPIPVRRELLGVNQLGYGDGYGLVDPRTHKVVPELVQLLKESGFASQRYPGGCGATHTFNWKVAAGLEGRKPVLGLMEFLNLCEATSMMPILSISGFRGSPEEAAELVEFLNSPADDAHPWAKRRAELGHPAPYKVRYFEYGNECYHGNFYVKPKQWITPEKYGMDYLAFQKAMKAVDPEIKLGVVLNEPGEFNQRAWDLPVLKVIGKRFDFLTPHQYTPVRTYDPAGYHGVFLEQRNHFRQTIKSCRAYAADAGVKELKLANTEFNSDVKSHRNLTSALLNAEWLRMFCYTPEFFTAHYWQFVNEGWGMVGGRKAPYVKRPNYLAMQLFGRYLLDELLTPEITGDNLQNRYAEARKLSKAELEKNILPVQAWKCITVTNAKITEHPDGVLEVEFMDDKTPDNFFHAEKSIPRISPNCGYRITGEVKAEGMVLSRGAALELCDARGWETTRSAAGTPGTLSADWKTVSADYIPRFDAENLTVKARRQGTGKGKMFFRNVKVTRFVPELRATDATVSRSADGKRLAAVVINRSFAPETMLFQIPGFQAVKAEKLTGPGPQADNESRPDTVKVVSAAFENTPEGCRITLPPLSLTGIALERK